MNAVEELRQIVALSLVKNMGPITFKRLLEISGSVSEIFKAPSSAFQKMDKRLKFDKQELKNKLLFQNADLEIDKAKKHGVEIISFFDERYPEELKNIYAPSIVLYVKGTLPKKETPKVAVVGSRAASLYGLKMARQISMDLASAGVVVVSGMALGIDTAAHEGALRGNGTTLAVLGNGLSTIYPPENKKIAEKIIEHGALISEYAMEVMPSPGHFPLRNRIISGLSRSVLVVEAREKSGALITVDAALEQGREVYALPGNVDSLKSQGTNRLLKQGARLVTSAEDILNDLNLKKPQAKVLKNPSTFSLTEEESRVLSFLNASEPIHIDTVIERSKSPTQKTLSVLTLLVMKQAVKELPGKYFVSQCA